MLYRLLIAACLLSLILAVSCSDDDNPVVPPTVTGSGDLITVQRTLSTFHTVSLTTVGTVRLTSGGTQVCSLTVDDNVEQYILTNVVGGVLQISSSSSVNLNDFDLTVYLTMTDLKGLSLGGVGTIHGINLFSADSVDIALSGVGNIIMELESDYIRSSLSGVGTIELSGTTDYHRLYHSAVGAISSFELISDTTIANLSGVGSAEVYVNDSLNVTIGGAGSLFYRGDPVITQQITGTGQVIDAN